MNAIVFRSEGKFLNDRIGSFVVGGFFVFVLTAYYGPLAVLIGLFVTAVLCANGLGWVSVEPERIVRWGFLRRKSVSASDVIAVELDTTYKQTWGRRQLKYCYPQLILTNGKRVRLFPPLPRSPQRTEQQIEVIRDTLDVPAVGTVVIPSANPLVCHFKTVKGTHTVTRLEDPVKTAHDKLYGEFTPLPGLEKHYQGR